MTRGIRTGIGFAAVAIALVVAACSDDEAPPDAGSSLINPPAVTSTLPPGPPAGGTPSDLPATVVPTASAGAEDCGVEEQVHGMGRNLDARECLWSAYSEGRPAIFTSSMLTIEGDPIVWNIAVISSDEIRVSVDNTQDRFASPADRAVRTTTCLSMALGDDPDLPMLLELSGCDTEGGELAV